MELSYTSKLFLACAASTPCNLKLEFFNELDEVIPSWKPSTRISPVWMANNEFVDEAPDVRRFCIFIGAFYPLTLADELELFDFEGTDFFLSLGHFNIVVSTDDDSLVNKIRGYCISNSIPFELWSGVNGDFNIANIESRGMKGRDIESTLGSLSHLARTNSKISSKVEASEFVSLMASSITRANSHNHGMLDKLTKLTNVVSGAFLDSLTETCGEATTRYLIKTNSALSRFCSQAFSGTSPIAYTECHFWYHSLLGVGLANIALQNLVDYIDDTLGQTLFIDRLKACASIYAGIRDLRSKSANLEYWKGISGQIMTEGSGGTEIPIISYFSGRDGYLSDHHYISAPLNSIAQCASIHWSLNTLTHEMCHIFLQEVMETLFPVDEEVTNGLRYSFDRAIELMETEEDGALSLLDRIRQLLLTSVLVSSDSYKINSEGDILSSKADLYSIKDHLRNKNRELEEILVHILDFQLFYGGRSEKYVKSIWNTWSVLPDIDYRITDYIVRTACALLCLELDRHTKTTVDDCLNEILESLKEISSDDFGYIEHAVNILTDDEMRSSITREVSNHIPTIKVAKYILYDKNFNVQLFTNSFDSKLFPRGVLTTHKFKNPLEFINENLSKVKNVEADSLWMLINLAFRIDKYRV